MIGIVGHMSGGKSYFAVEKMLDLLLRGHVVCSNIKLNCQGVTSYLQVPCLSWKQRYYYLDENNGSGYHHIPLLDYEAYPCGSPRGTPDYDQNLVYIFLDEASSIFDSMAHATDSNIVKVATWARQTKKLGIELYLIMQFASELNKRLRNHITEYVSCLNTSTVRIPVIGCRLPPFLRGFSVRTLYAQDAETPIGDSTWVRIKPEIYNCYNTGQIVVGHLGNSRPALPPLQLTHRHYVSACTQFGILLFLGLVFIIFYLGYLWTQMT